MAHQNGNGSRRLDGYVRVSDVHGREGESFISPGDQEERIRAWAVANGHEILVVHHELDVSGGKMDRPKLNEVMRRFDVGETDGVVVWKLNRFGRTLFGAAELIQHISDRGGVFASVNESFDITTPTGKLMLRILLSFAEFELDTIRENWRTARAAAVQRGIHVVSVAPFGYRLGGGAVNEQTGRRVPAPLEVDELTGPYATELFRRRAAGEPWLSLRQWLVDLNVPTVRGAPWSCPTLAAIVRNRVYLGVASGAQAGDLPDGVAGAHPALIDEATWHAAQSQRVPRRDRKESPTLLRGLVRCANCRYTMTIRRDPGISNGAGKPLYLYGCATAECQAKASIAAIAVDGQSGLDDAVVAAMWEHLERVAFESFDANLDIAEDEQERDELAARRDRDAADGELEQALGRRAWLKHLAGLTVQVDEKQTQIEEKLRLQGRPIGRPVKELREAWDSGEMSMEEKRTQIAAVVQMVFVKRNTSTRRGGLNPLPPELRRPQFAKRSHIIWATDPIVLDVPRQGRVDYVIKPFVFPDTDPDGARVMALQPQVEDAGGTIG